MPLATTRLCRPPKTPKLHQRPRQPPKLATPQETAPSNRTARGRAPDSITYNTLLTQAGARARRAPAAAVPAAAAPAVHVVVIGAARGAVARHSRPSPPRRRRTPRAASTRTWYRLGSPAVEVQTDRRRAAVPAVAAASSWEAAARRRFGFGAFHEFKLLRRQRSFIARFELQLPYFAVT